MQRAIMVLALGILSMSAPAKPSVNEMQACQALINFIEQKLEPKPEQYTVEEVSTVLKGIKAYDNYIQQEIVTPGLLQFNGNDKAKADAMQKQVDAYKAQLSKAYQSRYPQPRLFSDHAVALNECAKKAVPSGKNLEDLKASLQMILSLASRD